MGICPGSVRPKMTLRRRQSTSTSHKPTLVLNLISAMSLITAITFAALFFSLSPSKSTTATARPLRKLPHPVVILISSDGFHFRYQFKTPTPNIHRLINNGTEAQTGLIPVFPTLTFPNHYSIITGIYPPHHDIIYNFFIDPITSDKFTMASHKSKWWTFVVMFVSFCAGHFFVLTDKYTKGGILFYLYISICLPVTFNAAGKFSLFIDLIKVIWKKVPPQSFKGVHL